MISWISNLIQKRGKIIFSVLLFIIIIAFVFTIGAGPGIVSKDKTNYVREFYGLDLNSAADVQLLQNATMVSRYMNGVRQYDENQFQQQMLYRQVRMHLASQLSIPNPTEIEMAEFIKKKPAFMGSEGKFEKSAFEGFVDSIQGGAIVNKAFVAQTIKDDYRLEQLDLLMGSPGFALDQEIEASVARQGTVWNLEIAKSEYSDFNPEIDVQDEAVAAFFDNNQLRYEIPKEYSVSYVEFSADNIKTPIENPSDEDLQRYFLSNREIFSEAEKKVTPEPVEGEEAVELSPLEVFAKIKSDVYKAYAKSEKTSQAVVLANDFTGKLFDEGIEYQGIAFKKELVAHGLKLKSLPPFSANPSTQLVAVAPADFFANAMRLDEKRYFTDVIATRDGEKFIVGFLESTTPSRIPNLEEVKGQVVADYKEEQKTAQFSEKGIEVVTAVREKVVAGEAFQALAEAEAFAYENPEAFKLSDRPQGVPYQVLQAIEELNSGDVTDMIRIGNTGYVVYVKEKQLPEINKGDEDYISAEQGLNNYGGMIRYQALIEDMISKALNSEA